MLDGDGDDADRRARLDDQATRGPEQEGREAPIAQEGDGDAESFVGRQRRHGALHQIETEEQQPGGEERAEQGLVARRDLEADHQAADADDVEHRQAEIEDRQEDQRRGADVGGRHDRQGASQRQQSSGDGARDDEGDRGSTLGQGAEADAGQRREQRVAGEPAEKLPHAPRPELLELGAQPGDAGEEQAQPGEEERQQLDHARLVRPIAVRAARSRRERRPAE